MASYYASPNVLSSAASRRGLQNLIGIVRHQRERLAGVKPVATEAKPGPIKLGILAARAAAGLPLFPEGR